MVIDGSTDRRGRPATPRVACEANGQAMVPAATIGAAARATVAAAIFGAAARVIAIAATLAAAFAATPAALRAQDAGLPLGTVPESIVLEDLDGRPVDLGDYIGKKPVLVEFWATWCPVCEALQPRIEAAHRRFGDDVAFLIVAVGVNQNPGRIRRHLERHPMPGLLLWDGQGRAARAFQAPTTSYVVVLDGSGRVVYTGTGEDQEIEAAVQKAVTAS
mgnify:CR=1 FL=1